ncbi:M23 family metallopeptidase [Streptomyces sodiiphilus]|uniref:M23 family metallopeptidase n=1 Tax=Streptomyces sodiiphilus TaxID=226217 RepID=A0ABN2PRN1_9ACTN
MGCAVLTAVAPAQADSSTPTSPRNVEAIATEIERLRQEAARASERHERARRQEVRQRSEVQRLRGRLEGAREELAGLREIAGRQAREQYRNGGTSGLARLMLSDSPEHFLDQATRIGRGENAARQLLEQVLEAESQLVRDKTAAARAHARLREQEQRQRERKEGIDAKLARAERQLRELKEARQRAAARAAPAPGRVRHTPSGCPAAVRDAAALARRAGTADWVAPVESYVISASFAQAGGRWRNGHTGQDFAVPTGTPVRAVGDATVVTTGCGDAFGNSIVLAHDNGYYSQYAHLSLLEVKAGQRVGAGQRIGLSGSTGNSTGPHLHFEIRLTPYLGSAIDPVPWLRDHGVTI